MNNKDKLAHQVVGFNPAVLFKGGSFDFGAADMMVGGNSDQFLGRLVAFLLATVIDEYKKSPFRGITIIAPPASVRNLSEEDFLNAIAAGATSLRGEPPSLEEMAFIRPALTLIRCEQLTVDVVVEAVRSCGANKLICVVDAGKYRNNSLSGPTIIGRMDVLFEEDRWVAHSASLAAQCIEVVKVSRSYIAFHIDEEPPLKAESRKLLVDVDNLFPVFALRDNDPGQLVHDRARRWTAMATTGQLEDALSEIESTGLERALKAQLAIQLISRSGDHGRAANQICEELAKGAEFGADLAVRFARMAERANSPALAEKLLGSSLEHLSAQPSLETALECATSLGNLGLVQCLYDRLELLFPNTALALANRQLRLLGCCRVAPGLDAKLWPSQAGFTGGYEYLFRSLCAQVDVAYEEVVLEVQKRWPEEVELATICCAIHAQASMRSADAIGLAVSVAQSAAYERQAAMVVLWAVRRMMLTDEVPRGELGFYQHPIEVVVRYLARSPWDVRARTALSQLLSVESSGAIGLPIIAGLALDIATAGADIAPAAGAEQLHQISDDEFKVFYTKSHEWMDAQAGVELGVTRLPKEIAGPNTSAISAYLIRMIRYVTNRPDEDVDLKFLERCVHLVCLLEPYPDYQNEDIDALRLLGSKLWLEGQPQRARDLAEQILDMAGEQPKRQRLAWAAFADIYHRTNSSIDALIGISSAMAGGAKVNMHDLWQETYTLLRIARDLGLHDVARSLVPACRRLYEMLGVKSGGKRRMDTIELGLRLNDVNDANPVALQELVSDIAKNCAEVIDDKDELLPAASLLAQSVRLCDVRGMPVEEGIRTSLEKVFMAVGPKMESLLRSISTVSPSADDVIRLHARLDVARNTEDISRDLVVVVMAARRLLLGEPPELTAQAAALAIELLAERSVEVPEAPGSLTVEWPGEYARGLSEKGLAVCLLGLSTAGHLVAVVAQNGKLEVRQSATTEPSFQRRVDRWSAEYPRRYGLIPRDHGNNEFYVSMREIDIPLPQGSDLLIIAEPSLQQVPFNLVLINGEFLGATSAIGIAPSLTWFDAARRKRANHDGRRLAWISASEDLETGGTLGAVLGRLRPTFEKHNIVIDTSRRIPENLLGAQMVVVTAHGGLAGEGRFIRSISDEGVLVESPRALARSLAGVELVILFVCSGGRLDKHPFDNTTVGMPKQLLDRGCRAVVASPWPLDSIVTYRWLEDFLTAWDADETVLTATFRANQAVQAALGDPPQYGLAMTVYGDVLLRKG